MKELRAENISFDDMMDRLGLTPEDIENAEETEFMVEPFKFEGGGGDENSD